MADIGQVAQPRQVREGQRVMHLVAGRSLRASLFLLAGFVALVVLACGGDESPDEPLPATETATAATAETATETATKPATEAPPTEEPADDGGSVDQRYLSALCVAGNDFQATVNTAAIKMESEEGLEDDPEAFPEVFLEPMAGLLEALRDVPPPDDLAEYHAAALAQYEGLIGLFEAMREAAESGQEVEGGPFGLFSGMLEGAQDFPAIPEAALARLAEVAEGVPECAGSLFLEEFLAVGDAVSTSFVSTDEEPTADEQ